ncbi:hypothetical protein [Chitinophaga sp. GbtcB8]|nr:hypothetical protein [Chitinophaga sp. GbtcB8]
MNDYDWVVRKGGPEIQADELLQMFNCERGTQSAKAEGLKG